MYKVKLETFEGPLDLLLFFIKRDEIDIYDIPISKITAEFLQYVNLIKYLDLEIAGDFILMASTLMHIKVRMLLPKEVDEQGEAVDPRSELVNRLLEYKRFKEMSEDMSIMEANQRKVFFRSNYLYDPIERPPELESLLKNISVFDLAKVFKRVLENNKPVPVHQIKKIPVSIEDQIQYILTKMENAVELHFLSVIDGIREKIRLVVTFIALLEMVKMGQLGIRISPNFNDFILYKLA